VVRILAPHATVPVPTMRRVLCVLHPTRIHTRWEKAIAGSPVGEFDVGRLSSIRKLLFWKSHMQYFRANPRDVTYMLRLAYGFLKEHAPSTEVDLLVEATLVDRIPEEFRQWPRVLSIMQEPDATMVRTLTGGGYDTIVLLYPDAIGLGWGHVERIVAHLNPPHTLVINGRRRVFAWDKKSRRMLTWRRLVESSWVLELVMIPTVLLVSVLLGAWDALAGPRRKRS